MRVLTTALALVRDDLPEVGRSALSVAQSRWLKGQPVSLVASRIECWKYLDAKNGNSTTIADREDFAIRALICVLYDDEEVEDFDIYESVGFAVDMFAALQVGADTLLVVAEAADPRSDVTPPAPT